MGNRNKKKIQIPPKREVKQITLVEKKFSQIEREMKPVILCVSAKFSLPLLNCRLRIEVQSVPVCIRKEMYHTH